MSNNELRIIRDLRWAIGSEPLLNPAQDSRFVSSHWCQQQATEFEPLLTELGKDKQALEQLKKHAESLRLGGYFEQLFRYFLDHSPNYDCLAHDLQVHEQGRTLGAFDFIVRDRNSGDIEHWELACKFYLQDGAGDQIEDWYGPGRKDRLMIKYQHLLRHQIALSQSEAGIKALAAQGWQVKTQRIIVKGRLFGAAKALPSEVNPHCLRGWLSSDRHSSQQPLTALQRQHWLSPIQAGDITQSNPLSATRRGCVCLSEQGPEAELSRGFVVPSSWFGRAEE